MKCDYSDVGILQFMICYLLNIITIIQMCIQDIQFSNLYSLETVSALSHSVDIVISLEQKKLNDLQSIYDNKVKKQVLLLFLHMETFILF